MKYSIRLTICLAVLIGSTTGSIAQTWHSTEGPRRLKTDSSRVLVKLADPKLDRDMLYSIDRISHVSENFVMGTFVACSLDTKANYSSFLDSLRAMPEIELVEPYYLTGDTLPLLVGETFCVKFRKSVTRNEIDNINKLYDVTVDYKFGGKSTLFILKNSHSSGYNTVELANLYHEMPQTEIAHPDFGVPIVLDNYNLYDRYSSYQYQIKKVIGDFNQATVWDFAGLTQDIIVAVIDNGVEEHEDLPAARILPGVDLADNDNDPSPFGTAMHGQGCAGIIAASHTTDSALIWADSTGVISLNPHVLILPIKTSTDVFVYNPDPTAQELGRFGKAIDTAWQMGADVISCSWSIHPAWQNDARITVPINAGIENALLWGRNGLGTPVVFAAGNDGSNQLSYPASHPDAFSVGAIDTLDERFDYSNYHDSLDIVAPSGGPGDYVWTLDCMGTKGLNRVVGIEVDTGGKGLMDTLHPPDIYDCPPGEDNIDYMCAFSGTSAAAPVVAGVMSLLISRADTLYAQWGWESSIYDIIRLSAVTDLDWGSINAPDSEYGYGRVDAFRAILSIARGDVDNNGVVDVGDLTEMTRLFFIVLEDAFPSPYLADCNCDGEMDIGDLTEMINHLYVTLAPLPIPCYEFGD